MYLNEGSWILIFYGDVLFISENILICFLNEVLSGDIGVLIVKLLDFIGYGCIVWDYVGVVWEIVEEKDVGNEICKIVEVNIGIMLVDLKDF